MSLAPSGTLAELAVSDLMSEIFRARQSGVLEVVNGKVKKQVAFYQGLPVAIQSNAMSESLFRLLESARRMSAEDVAQLRADAAKRKQPVEVLLLEKQIVTKEEMPRLKNALNQLRLVGLFAWTEGDFRFSSRPVPEGPALPVPAAIMQAVRRRSDGGALLRGLEPRRKERPRAVANPPYAPSEFALSDDALEFFNSLDGEREIGEILAFSGLPPDEVALLLFALSMGGMIEDATQAGISISPSSGAGQRIGARKQPDSGSLPGAIATPPPAGQGQTQPSAAIAMAHPDLPAPPAAAIAMAPPEVMAIAPPPPIAVPPPLASVVAAPPPPIVVSPVDEKPERQSRSRGSRPSSTIPAEGRKADLKDRGGQDPAPPPVMVLPSEPDPSAPRPGTDPSPESSAGDAPIGRYVMGRSEVPQEPQSRDDEAPGAPDGDVGGLSIDDMIAEEIGELDEQQFIPVKLEHDPLLDINMSGYADKDVTAANDFKEAYVRMHKQNYFEIFGMDRRAKAADIRKAYFALAKEYHSDRLVKLPADVQKLGTEMFNMIQKAYDTLTDPESREKYVDATFYGKANDEEAAIEEVQAVLQADQHYKTGMGLLNAGNLGGAHAAFSRARDLYPKEPEYNVCYGYTLFRMNHPKDPKKCEEGERIIHDALRQNAKLDRANVYLGRIYLAKDDLNLAARYFVRALKANPSNLEAGRELQQLKAKRDQQSTGLISSFLGKFKK